MKRTLYPAMPVSCERNTYNDHKYPRRCALADDERYTSQMPYRCLCHKYVYIIGSGANERREKDLDRSFQSSTGGRYIGEAPCISTHKRVTGGIVCTFN